MEIKDWKEKALERTAENKQLKKKIKELKNSRDSWKKNRSIINCVLIKWNSI